MRGAASEGRHELCELRVFAGSGCGPPASGRRFATNIVPCNSPATTPIFNLHSGSSLRRDERARAKCGPPPPEAAARAAGAAVESNYQPRPEAGRPYSPPSKGLLCRRSLPSTFAGYGPKPKVEYKKKPRLLTGHWLRPALLTSHFSLLTPIHYLTN